MKTLEEEAQEFEDGNYMTATDKDVFIAGANSKWVQAEKIKIISDIKEKLKNCLNDLNMLEENICEIIIELRQQIKQLEE